MGAFTKSVIHEGEYVLIPARTALPISSTTNSTPASNTPVRIRLPLLSRGVHDQFSSKDEPPFISRSSSVNVGDSVPDEILPLVHRWSHTHSILCVLPAPSRELIFCGTQDSKILVFDIKSYSLKHVINCGHNQFAASVLCLDMSPDENFLFSAGSDSLVKVWDLSPFNDSSALTYQVFCTYVVYALVDIGDIFSISWSTSLSALFIGAQNASILWCRLPLSHSSKSAVPIPTSVHRLPHFRFDKFFDSKGPGGSMNRLQSQHQIFRSSNTDSASGPTLVEIKNNDFIRFAHNGYVYCLEFLNERNASGFCDLYRDKYHSFLASCGGDGVINIWGINIDDNDAITLSIITKLENDEAILSMHVVDSSICVGLSDSSINAWDLTTFQLTRSFHFISGKENDDEVLSLCIFNGCIYKATNMGGLCKFTLKNDIHTEFDTQSYGNNQPITRDLNYSQQFQQDSVNVEDDSVFAVQTFQLRNSTFLLSGGNGSLCLWNITNVGDTHLTSTSDERTKSSLKSSMGEVNVSNEHLLESLKRLISYKTISKYPSLYLEDSRRCAQFFSKLFMSLGAAETKLLPVPNCNPVVFARFKRNCNVSTKPVRVLWYAHYDVVEATQDKECWTTDPFRLTAKDGNLYARGVSDNKGPSLAAIYAVAELFKTEKLSTDVVFIIEGEEECGSIGFQDIINKNKEMIGDIDWILLSNSYWLGDEIPCLNYGLRGVLSASIEVQSEKPDRHSGVDGGVSKEPTMDLIQVLGELMCPKSNKIKIPNFYDDVLPINETELKLYEKIKDAAVGQEVADPDLQSLLAKWRNPSLTVHRIDVSGPKNNTVISQMAKACISVRVVPNQDLQKIKEQLIAFLQAKFAELQTDNKLSINVFHEAEPWLGDPNNLVFKVLYEKMKLNWGPTVPDPLFIREGGSIPSIRFLEKAFDAPAAQIPCGQASDNAHLKDEKLRIINLYKLRSILTDTFRELGLA